MYCLVKQCVRQSILRERERERVLFIEWGNGVRKILYYSKLKYSIIDLNKLVSEKNVKKFMSIFQDDPTQ